MADENTANTGGPSLTDAEMAKIRASAREAVQKEQHDKLFKEALEKAKREARIEAGLVADPNATPEIPLVPVTINLPDSITPLACLSTDGRNFWHGETYRVTHAVAMDLNARQWAAWVQDGRIKGTWSDVNRPKPTAINATTGSTAGHMPVAIGRAA